MGRKSYVIAGLAVVAVIAGVTAAILYWRPSITISRTYSAAGLTTSGMPAKEHVQTATKLLSVAVAQRRHDVVTWLLEEGADANGIAPEAAPLRWAVANDDLDMVKVLLAHGANPRLDMGDGWTVMQFAESRGNQTVIDALGL